MPWKIVFLAIKHILIATSPNSKTGSLPLYQRSYCIIYRWECACVSGPFFLLLRHKVHLFNITQFRIIRPFPQCSDDISRKNLNNQSKCISIKNRILTYKRYITEHCSVKKLGHYKVYCSISMSVVNFLSLRFQLQNMIPPFVIKPYDAHL